MPINPSNIIPKFCQNCTHRFVCGIQAAIREQDTNVKDFNADNVTAQQSVTSINYTCRYKSIEVQV